MSVPLKQKKFDLVVISLFFTLVAGFFFSSFFTDHFVIPITVEQALPYFFEKFHSRIKPETVEQSRFLFFFAFSCLSIFGVWFCKEKLFLWNEKFSKFFERCNHCVQFVLCLTLLWVTYRWQIDTGLLFKRKDVVRFLFMSVVTVGFLFFARNRKSFHFTIPNTVVGFSVFIFLISGFYTDQNLLAGSSTVYWHLPYYVGEFAAIVSGKTPLVDYFPQYQNLLALFAWPYFKVFGLSVTTFSVLMLSLSALAFFSLYAALLKFSESRNFSYFSLLACLSMSFYNLSEQKQEFLTSFNYFAVGPIRLVGPAFLFLLICFYFQKKISSLVLFFLSAVIALNNSDFGMGAHLACLVAVVGAETIEPKRFLKKFIFHFVRFLLSTVAVLLIFTLFVYLKSSHLPAFSLLLTFQKYFGVFGFFMLPMPQVSFIYAMIFTYLVAIGMGFFFNKENTLNQLRSALLIYSGVFGLASSFYYIGRSHPYVLLTLMFPWTASLSFIVAISFLAFKTKRFENFKPFLFLGMTFVFFFGISLVKVLDLPSPRLQVLRFLPGYSSQNFQQWEREQLTLIQSYVRAEEPVLMNTAWGHYLALKGGFQNVFPFTQELSFFLKLQVPLVLKALDEHSVRILWGSFPVELESEFTARGFEKVNSFKEQSWDSEIVIWRKK